MTAAALPLWLAAVAGRVRDRDPRRGPRLPQGGREALHLQRPPSCAEQRRVNVDFPSWMIESLDREARRLGVTRQSIIKLWIAERLERGRTAA